MLPSQKPTDLQGVTENKIKEQNLRHGHFGKMLFSTVMWRPANQLYFMREDRRLLVRFHYSQVTLDLFNCHATVCNAFTNQAPCHSSSCIQLNFKDSGRHPSWLSRLRYHPHFPKIISRWIQIMLTQP